MVRLNVLIFWQISASNCSYIVLKVPQFIAYLWSSCSQMPSFPYLQSYVLKCRHGILPIMIFSQKYSTRALNVVKKPLNFKSIKGIYLKISKKKNKLLAFCSALQPQIVLALFLFFRRFQPRCSYKVGSYKKKSV